MLPYCWFSLIVGQHLKNKPRDLLLNSPFFGHKLGPKKINPLHMLNFPGGNLSCKTKVIKFVHSSDGNYFHLSGDLFLVSIIPFNPLGSQGQLVTSPSRALRLGL